MGVYLICFLVSCPQRHKSRWKNLFTKQKPTHQDQGTRQWRPTSRRGWVRRDRSQYPVPQLWVEMRKARKATRWMERERLDLWGRDQYRHPRNEGAFRRWWQWWRVAQLVAEAWSAMPSATVGACPHSVNGVVSNWIRVWDNNCANADLRKQESWQRATIAPNGALGAFSSFPETPSHQEESAPPALSAWEAAEPP